MTNLERWLFFVALALSVSIITKDLIIPLLFIRQ